MYCKPRGEMVSLKRILLVCFCMLCSKHLKVFSARRKKRNNFVIRKKLKDPIKIWWCSYINKYKCTGDTKFRFDLDIFFTTIFKYIQMSDIFVVIKIWNEKHEDEISSVHCAHPLSLFLWSIARKHYSDKGWEVIIFSYIRNNYLLPWPWMLRNVFVSRTLKIIFPHTCDCIIYISVSQKTVRNKNKFKNKFVTNVNKVCHFKWI